MINFVTVNEANLIGFERVKNDANGNPRYRVVNMVKKDEIWVDVTYFSLAKRGRFNKKKELILQSYNIEDDLINLFIYPSEIRNKEVVNIVKKEQEISKKKYLAYMEWVDTLNK